MTKFEKIKLIKNLIRDYTSACISNAFDGGWKTAEAADKAYHNLKNKLEEIIK